MKEIKVKKILLIQMQKEMIMTKFNIGDKVTVKDCNLVYEITHITRDGCYVIESDAVKPEIYSWCWLKLYQPPVFSYYHPVYGLHDWEVTDKMRGNNIVITANDSKIDCAVPVELVKHYLGDKYVR